MYRGSDLIGFCEMVRLSKEGKVDRNSMGRAGGSVTIPIYQGKLTFEGISREIQAFDDSDRDFEQSASQRKV
jgi:hypothetical protein